MPLAGTHPNRAKWDPMISRLFQHLIFQKDILIRIQGSRIPRESERDLRQRFEGAGMTEICRTGRLVDQSSVRVCLRLSVVNQFVLKLRLSVLPITVADRRLTDESCPGVGLLSVESGLCGSSYSKRDMRHSPRKALRLRNWTRRGRS